MTLINDIMPYFDEFIHVYGWNLSINVIPLKIWTPKNFTTANYRHPVSKSWLRHCSRGHMYMFYNYRFRSRWDFCCHWPSNPCSGASAFNKKTAYRTCINTFFPCVLKQANPSKYFKIGAPMRQESELMIQNTVKISLKGNLGKNTS